MTPSNMYLELLKINSDAYAAGWNFYFVVLVGIVTIVSVVLADGRRLSAANRIFLGCGVVVFGAANLLSLYQSFLAIGQLGAELSTQLPADKQWLVAEPSFGWSLLMHPVGTLLAAAFIWRN